MGFLFSKNEEVEEKGQKLKNELQEIEKKKYGKIDEYFERYDLNNDGSLESKEIKLALTNYIEQNQNTGLEEVIRLIDDNEVISVKKSDFRSLMSIHMKDQMESEDWLDTFKVFDKNLSGTISSDEIVYVFQKLGLNISKKDAEEMILEASPNSTNLTLSFDEFLTIMLSN